MSVNSSSSSNASLPPSSPFTYFSGIDMITSCFKTTVGIYSITAFTITSIVIVLPLYIFVLYLGLQRRRQQRSNATTSHSDVFTYHMVVIELMSVSGSTLTCCGVHADVPEMLAVGIHLLIINICGQMCFHLLTCVERYLAVVHPVTYLNLRKEKGIRIRNIVISCVYLVYFTGAGIAHVKNFIFPAILSFLATAFILLVVSFCSLSVLCVLIRPGPGEGGGGRQRTDQSKLKAFYTIIVIMGVLLFRVAGYLLTTIVLVTPQIGKSGGCAVWLTFVWFCLPSSLVLPLLFLQRGGLLMCCKSSNQDQDHLSKEGAIRHKS